MSTPRKSILIVDDESTIRRSLELVLSTTFDVTTAENGAEAMKCISGSTPDLILLDVMMPVMGGLETLAEIKKTQPLLPVIMLTGAQEVKTAVSAIKYGAVDYIGKPFDVEELTQIILQSLNTKKSDETHIESDFGILVGNTPPMKELFKSIQQVAPKNATVLITGESGTGKELIAREIHSRSARKDSVFIPLNCAAIPESLIESELFGHEKGAFTGASETRIGYFEQANGGTLFLDEIGELSLSVQVKLLRFLQEQEFVRVGRSKSIKVDVRVLAATNKNLEKLVAEGKFRQDLLYRISVVHFEVPSLRERYDDLPRLFDHFCKKFTPRYGERKLQFSPEALQIFYEYQWPGNVRELENVIESVLAIHDENFIERAMLPKKLLMPSVCIEKMSSMRSSQQGLSFEEAEKKFETDMILSALKRTNFVQTRAAEILGISRRILKYKMDKLGIKEQGGEIQ